MRTALLSLLICALLTACRSADVGPVQLLYKTWQLQPAMSSSATAQLLTFRADGQVRYGESQNEAGCCRPGQFGLANNQLTFAITYGNVDCSLVYCAQSPLITNSPWTIDTLTDSELVISHNGESVTFKAR